MAKTSKAFWHKVIPFPVGTEIQTISQDAYTPTGFSAQSPPLGSKGTIERYVDKRWKIEMVDVGCYPPEILTETMYCVRFPHLGISYAMRGEEIEAIQ